MMKQHGIFLFLGTVLVGTSLLFTIDTVTSDHIQNLPQWLAVLSATTKYLGKAGALPFVLGIALYSVVAFRWQYKIAPLLLLVTACTILACCALGPEFYQSALLEYSPLWPKYWVDMTLWNVMYTLSAVILGRIARWFVDRRRHIPADGDGRGSAAD